MGITEVSMQAEEFVAGNPQYAQFAEWCETMRLTPIFEWCSRKQRIVVDYPKDRLVLIALRHTVLGGYKTYCDLVVLGDRFNIEVVQAYEGTTENMENLISKTRAMEDAEGWIIRFDNGQMLKIKGDWYVRIHKTKDNLIWEKNVVDLLINEKMDDVKPYMLDEDIRRVELFETDFWIGINDTVNRYETYFQQVLSSELDRKSYAQQWMPTIVKQDSFAPQFVFSRFDGKDPRQLVIDQIRKNTGSQTRIDSVRDMWGGAKWTYSFESDS
jgi:RNA ligase